jgi:hypothetical protein
MQSVPLLHNTMSPLTAMTSMGIACALVVPSHSYFRCQPNEALERVLAAAAKAVANMPNLRSLTITLDICPCLRTDEQPEKFELAYGTRGSEIFETGAGAVTLDWIAPREWKMSEELEVLWRRVLGPSAEVTYYSW